MNPHHNVNITVRDRLMRAWENSMELVRDYENYIKELNDEALIKLFGKFAKDEAEHATQLRELLLQMQDN